LPKIKPFELNLNYDFMKMKAIIPVAGLGSRLRPHTHTQPKSLIPVAGKPILAHIVDDLIEQGFTEFIFIIGYLGDKIEKYINKNYPNINPYFVVQTKGKGTAHAIWLAKDLIVDDDLIFIVLGDTIFKADLGPILKNNVTSLGVKKVEDPRQFGVAELSEDGWVKKLVEKPSIPKSNLALIGIYRIGNTALFKNCLNFVIENEIKSHDEFHLTDVLMEMYKSGEQIKTFSVESWFDCGKKDILLETNAILLKLGNYKAANSAQYENTIIVDPVYIGENVNVSNSIIGPNVSIGDNSTIEYSILKNSIIGSYTHLDTANLEKSVVGNDSLLKGTSLSLNLGDNTEIKIQ
jgi:glucose-1-phosphate thymidylyltransferase